MKSPDDVKKMLKYSFKSCWTALELGDPLGYPQAVISAYEAMGNALDFIQQLEAQNTELLEKIEQLQAERDAAVADIHLAYTSYVGACQTCMHAKNQYDCDSAVGCAHCTDEKCVCQSCDNDYCNWQWRGVQKEE